MATKIPTKTVVAVNASNVVLGAGGTAGTAVRQRQVILRAVSSNGKVIESNGAEGVVTANPPVMAVRIVDASNAIIKSDGTASTATAQPDMVAMFVGSDGVGYGSSGSGIPVMDVHIVDETSTFVDTLFGSGHSDEATAFIARTSGLDQTHTDAYYALIDDLVTDGVFAKLDVLYVFATQDATTSLLNLCSSSFNATAVSGPTFAADAGYTSNGSSQYIDSNYNPSTQGVNFTLDSCSLSSWSLTDRASGNLNSCGSFDGTTDITALVPFLSYGGNDSIVSRLNENVGAANNSNIATSLGFTTASRNSNLDVKHYHNGSAQSTTVGGISDAIPNLKLFCLARNDNGTAAAYTTDQIAVIAFGGELSDTDAGNLYTRLNTYLTAVGAL